MSIIKPEEFWDLFAKLPNIKSKAELRADYISNGKWTVNIKSFLESIKKDLQPLSDILADSEIILKPEGNRKETGMSGIDFIFYKSNIAENNEIIFIEHENHPNPPNFNELDKLYKINSNELKVLIWYYNAVTRDVTNDLNAQKLKIKNFFIDRHNENYDNWLIILGPATIGKNHNTESGKNTFYNLMQNKDYLAYKIDKKDSQISLIALEKKQIISTFINVVQS